MGRDCRLTGCWILLRKNSREDGAKVAGTLRVRSACLLLLSNSNWRREPDKRPEIIVAVAQHWALIFRSPLPGGPAVRLPLDCGGTTPCSSRRVRRHAAKS